MDILSIRNFGPIKRADIEIGDITVFVGPQSSGKTIVSLLLAYFLDRTAIEKEMSKFAFWISSRDDLMDILFFPGVRELYYNKNTKIQFGEKNFEPLKTRFIREQKISHKVIYIPAQRSNLIFTGYPLAFESLPPSLPFPVKFFSSFLRQILSEFSKKGVGGEIFPKQRKLRDTLRGFLQSNIMMDTTFVLEKDEFIRQMAIKVRVKQGSIHISSAASGLRESFPILMTIQHIMGKKNLRSKELHLIIEEPETNLHPDAIKALFTLFTYIISRGTKVILTTHSPYILELLHFFKLAGEKYKCSQRTVSNIVADFLGLHGIRNMSIKDILLIDKSTKVYFFNRKENGLTKVKDISDLTSDYDWGGLSSFTFNIGESYEKLLGVNQDE